MKLNLSKSNYMIINSNDVCTTESIKINGTNIERVEQVKSLGMIISKNMKMRNHAEYIVKKSAKKLVSWQE